MQIRELLALLETQLASVENPRLESELICAHVLKSKLLELQLRRCEKLDLNTVEKILNIANQRVKKKIPLQYLFGVASFRDLDLYVQEGVLIPRPETEQLVEHALRFLKNKFNPFILELCAGSCAISLSLATEVKKCTIDAVELDDLAFKLGEKNIKKIAPINTLSLYKGDLFTPLKKGKQYDLLISNPPYISIEDYSVLPDEVRLHEPKIALTDGADGLHIIARIIQLAPSFLNDNGAIVLEIGETQGEACALLLEEDFKEIKILNDYTNRVRFAFAIVK